VKEQVVSQLSDGDRAALQGLIPLAGALGAGTIFALFFGGRKRGSGVAVFELCAIVAVLASVGMTAYLAISLLHQDMAISDRDLTQTAMPLIFAVILLVLVSAIARFPGSLERVFLFLPLGLMAGVVAAWFAISSWSFSPEDAMLTALLILGAGGVAALFAWGLDRLDSRWERSLAQRRFVRRAVAGYRVTEKRLRPSLPDRKREAKAATVSCWIRKDRVYLDGMACQQLRDEVAARWDRVAEDKGRMPTGSTALTRVYVTHYLWGLVRTRSACFWLFEPAADDEIQARPVKANDDGLFDVTELKLV
jgi:hypothetical protein